jgi:hypothetical protein
MSTLDFYVNNYGAVAGRCERCGHLALRFRGNTYHVSRRRFLSKGPFEWLHRPRLAFIQMTRWQGILLQTKWLIRMIREIPAFKRRHRAKHSL